MKFINKRQPSSIIIRGVIAIVLGVLMMPTSHAIFFEDKDSSTDNLFSATNLDLSLESDEGNFEPNDGWIPGSSAERVFTVKNLGDLPFVYGLKYANGEGSDLCRELELSVEYEGEEVYNDKLEDFDVMYDSGDTLFDHMMLPVGNDEHNYTFKIWLPINDDTEGLSDETCGFDIAAYGWMENLDPYTGFWDEDSLSNSIETTDYEEPQACEIGQEVFMIGDKEGSQEDNPVNELNWSGEFGVFPDFADPFVVGTNTDNQFPWNSNYDKDEATDFDVDFFYTGADALVKLTIGWSPGKSDTEKKEVFLDGDNVGHTPDRLGIPVDGWWEDMARFEDEIIFPLEHGAHTLNLKHLKGDGTLWDYVKLEIIGCSDDEGDVIINEVMWSGSTQSSEDEWIELYNDTSHDISLDYWTIENAGDGGDITLPPEATIPSHGYYLISNFDSNDSNSALSDDNIAPDYVVDLDLDDGGEELILKDAFGNVADTADGSGGWEAGENGEAKRSMERNNDHGGWHSCDDADTTDQCNSTSFWDDEGSNYGTPAAENKSENDPSEATLAELGSPVVEDVPKLDDSQKETSESDSTQEEQENNELTGIDLDGTVDTSEEMPTDGTTPDTAILEEEPEIVEETQQEGTTNTDVVVEEQPNV